MLLAAILFGYFLVAGYVFYDLWCFTQEDYKDVYAMDKPAIIFFMVFTSVFWLPAAIYAKFKGIK